MLRDYLTKKTKATKKPARGKGRPAPKPGGRGHQRPPTTKAPTRPAPAPPDPDAEIDQEPDTRPIPPTFAPEPTADEFVEPIEPTSTKNEGE